MSVNHTTITATLLQVIAPAPVQTMILVTPMVGVTLALGLTPGVVVTVAAAIVEVVDVVVEAVAEAAAVETIKTYIVCLASMSRSDHEHLLKCDI